MVDRPPPAQPPENEKKPGFGDMTRAWFDAGSEVADFEAGRNAERRRIILATVGVILVVGGIVAAVVFVLN
jgi:hypothetical protein